MDYIRMNKKKKRNLVLCIIGGLVTIVIVIEILSRVEFTRKPFFGKELVLEHHLRYAKGLKDGVPIGAWKAPIDEQRRDRAIEILSDGKIREEVLFLYNAVAHHNVYRYMSRHIFVDEDHSVSEIAYRISDDGSGKPGSKLMFLPKDIFYQIRNGWYSFEFVLKPSNKVAEPTVSDPNSYEPDHLYLPKEIYESIIAGKGQMLLLDKAGKVLDTLPITITEFQ